MRNENDKWDGKDRRLSENQVYYRLELKQAELTHALFHRIFELESGFYNGHYRKREDGSFHMDYYPIPVISVKNYCDVEIGLDSISISTKLKRNAAFSYDYSKLHAYRFERTKRRGHCAWEKASGRNEYAGIR